MDVAHGGLCATVRFPPPHADRARDFALLCAAAPAAVHHASPGRGAASPTACKTSYYIVDGFEAAHEIFWPSEPSEHPLLWIEQQMGEGASCSLNAIFWQSRAIRVLQAVIWRRNPSHLLPWGCTSAATSPALERASIQHLSGGAWGVTLCVVLTFLLAIEVPKFLGYAVIGPRGWCAGGPGAAAGG